MADATGGNVKGFAVTVTGMITPDSDVVALKTSEGNRMPVITNLFTEFEKAKRWARRLELIFRRVLGFVDDKHVVGKPIIAVKEVNMPAPKVGKARGPMTEEQKQKMQAGRKKKAAAK